MVYAKETDLKSRILLACRGNEDIKQVYDMKLCCSSCETMPHVIKWVAPVEGMVVDSSILLGCRCENDIETVYDGSLRLPLKTFSGKEAFGAVLVSIQTP